VKFCHIKFVILIHSKYIFLQSRNIIIKLHNIYFYTLFRIRMEAYYRITLFASPSLPLPHPIINDADDGQIEFPIDLTWGFMTV